MCYFSFQGSHSFDISRAEISECAFLQFVHSSGTLSLTFNHTAEGLLESDIKLFRKYFWDRTFLYKVGAKLAECKKHIYFLTICTICYSYSICFSWVALFLSLNCSDFRDGKCVGLVDKGLLSLPFHLCQSGCFHTWNWSVEKMLKEYLIKLLYFQRCF